MPEPTEPTIPQTPPTPDQANRDVVDFESFEFSNLRWQSSQRAGFESRQKIIIDGRVAELKAVNYQSPGKELIIYTLDEKKLFEVSISNEMKAIILHDVLNDAGGALFLKKIPNYFRPLATDSGETLRHLVKLDQSWLIEGDYGFSGYNTSSMPQYFSYEKTYKP